MLPPDTQEVWNFLKEQPALAGFILIGGSGLALRIEHRLSEDLDLACCESRPYRMPRFTTRHLTGNAMQSHGVIMSIHFAQSSAPNRFDSPAPTATLTTFVP